MSVAKIKIEADEINFEQLDSVIRKYIPSGFSIRDKAHPFIEKVSMKDVFAPVDMERAEKSIGTLGSGNHFIEVSAGSDNSVYLVVHSGSRHLGKEIAEYYQDLAYQELMDTKIGKDLAYLEGENFEKYIHDMKIAQKFASVNREAIIQVIVEKMGWTSYIVEQWESIHNFIDMETFILRKGATPAYKGQRVLIPINMRDGSIIANGKGNEDWNYSAPHGAGRIMSRAKAKEIISMEEFEESMKGVWSTSVKRATIDESPFAYKPMQEIIENTRDTVEIIEVIKPLYNFKAN